MRIAIVLWSGTLGGAETLMTALADRFRARGHAVTVVIVTDAEPLSDRMHASRQPFIALGARRGAKVFWRPRWFAKAVARAGVDVALVMEQGRMPLALRLGGYRGRIVAVEHGDLLRHQSAAPLRRAYLAMERLLASLASDAEVVVSNYMLDRALRWPSVRRPIVIWNAVDTNRYKPFARLRPNGTPTIGWAGRMIPGKGLPELLNAVARLEEPRPRLRLAGSGELNDLVRELAQQLGLESIELVGDVQDMPEFWNSVDIAVTPSSEFAESFGMAALEASATGRPVIGTDNGGLTEIIVDGVTGKIVRRGDIGALSEAFAAYQADPSLAVAHGHEARRRAESLFDLELCATRYLTVLSGSDAG